MDTSLNGISSEQHSLEFLRNQQKWFSRKASLNKDFYIASRVVALLSASLGTIAAGLAFPTGVSSALAMAVVLATGLEGIYRWHENSLGYRLTSELLKQEDVLYHGGGGVYAVASDQDRVRLLTERVVALIATDNQRWHQLMAEENAKRDAASK